MTKQFTADAELYEGTYRYLANLWVSDSEVGWNSCYLGSDFLVAHSHSQRYVCQLSRKKTVKIFSKHIFQVEIRVKRNTLDTRMHSSRMRTARFSGHLGVGGVCPGGSTQGGFVCLEVVSARGVSALGVSVRGSCLPRRRVCLGVGGVCVGGYTPALQAGIHTWLSLLWKKHFLLV